MLRALSIRDYVIVDRLDLEAGGGFIALTGETGAGKSILVDALSLALGGRADAGVVRAGCARAEIGADFDVAKLPRVQEWLADQALDEEGGCLLRRTVDSGGRSRAYVNGRPATAAQLRDLGEQLVDIHGQHDHQLLLRRDHQRALLDAFAGAESVARETAERFSAWRRLADQHAARVRAQSTSARERELVAHELRELESLAFDARQWIDDQAEHRRLAHAQELIDTVSACAELLDESDGAVTSILAQAASRLGDAAELDAELEAVRRDVETAGVHASEAAQSLRRYLQRLEVDPGRLGELDRRLQAVHDCARKHRVEADAIPQLLEERRARLAELGGEESLERLREHEAAAEKAYRETARRLGEARRGAATQLGMEVTRTMQRLAMQGGRLVVALEPLAEPSADGLESVELQVSTHPG